MGISWSELGSRWRTRGLTWSNLQFWRVILGVRVRIWWSYKARTEAGRPYQTLNNILREGIIGILTLKMRKLRYMYDSNLKRRNRSTVYYSNSGLSGPKSWLFLTTEKITKTQAVFLCLPQRNLQLKKSKIDSWFCPQMTNYPQNYPQICPLNLPNKTQCNAPD